MGSVRVMFSINHIHRRSVLRAGAALVAGLAGFPGAARATGPAGSSPVLLELVPPDGNEPLRLTRAELEALPQAGFETTTIWTGGRTRFSGPRLADVLALAQLGGKAVLAVAENDYSVRIPADAVGPDVPIVALRLNGEPFGRRELGPLWIVFPYDSDPAYQSEVVYSMSIWQLIRIQPDPG